MSTTETQSHGLLEWSAFGANYPDTSCSGGTLVDLDSLDHSDIPCPLCDPAGFFEYQWGGTDTHPICPTCETEVAVDALTFHDGKALTWTADCPTCGPNQRLRMVSTDAEATR